MSYQNYSSKQLQAIDAAHHLHPFTDHKDLRGAGSRIISRGEGPFVYDTDGNAILDGMAGLWCVNIGYGRAELAEAAYRQMRELPYYNSFFRCATPPAVLLAQRIAELAPPSLNQVFFGSSGSEANDTAVRLVRHYWALEGRPEKNRIISREMAYHGSTIAGASLGGMPTMHGQLHGAVPNIVHVMMPYAYELALPGESDHDFGLRAAKAVEDPMIKDELVGYSWQRQQFATELRTRMKAFGDDPSERGSMGGGLHRGWMDVKAAFTGGDGHVVLSECEKAEDSTIAAYREAMSSGLPAEYSELVESQFQTMVSETLAQPAAW